MYHATLELLIQLSVSIVTAGILEKVSTNLNTDLFLIIAMRLMFIASIGGSWFFIIVRVMTLTLTVSHELPQAQLALP